MFPVRCYTCNTVLAHHYPSYRSMTSGLRTSPSVAMERLGVERMCCRRMFISHVDVRRGSMQYGNEDIVLEKGEVCLKRRVEMERTVSCD